MARKDIGNIPDWAITWAEKWCDRNGTTLNQLIRDYIVKVAKEERDSITLSGQNLAAYKNLCKARGYQAEVALSLHIQNVISRSR